MMSIPKHFCIQCRHEWPMIVEHPRKCPNCQNRKWSARDFVEAAPEKDLEAMVEYGRRRNFSCVSPPAWDNDRVGDIKDDIITSLTEGWGWGRLISEWLNIA